MTPEQFANRLSGKLNRILTGPAFLIASKDALALQSRRIFVDGKKSDDSPLGSYSTTPITVDSKALPKTGNQRGKSGRQTKSSYYAGGYRELRQQQGRESGFVNLRFSNDLQSDFLNSVIAATSNALGDVNPTVVTPLEVNLNLKQAVNIRKLNSLELRYGVFTDLTGSEKTALVNSFAFQIRTILND